ncbi:ABC transporter ATP-binding protein [Geomicrobium sp. JSM 1781026]|uniref:ABC transporter ATP-binding protein n=1 Tax=unclassified Geomicrobium TaxID=2628951 RepID=UPI00045F29E9|nr:ABC transporter ATP-binding protein [Geomicrobium sp. JCM 19039]GAK10813.1 bacitracin export ATP-binding protein BceA [Geomicrobium sp. JCM 19039]
MTNESTPRSVLIAEGIRKTYSSHQNAQNVLNGIDLRVTEGEFIGIMGPSGSGKTTLLNTLATIDRATDGKVFINDYEITAMKDRKLSNIRREHLGFIFQDYNLLDTLTVKENILLPISLTPITNSQAERAFHDIATMLEIEELANKYPSEISGGQKQRTSAARALIHSPSIVFADEPTGALDSKAASNLLDNLYEINQLRKVTIVMVSHDPLASSYCSRVVFLHDGHVYSELYRGDKTRDAFFKDILDMQAVLGGGHVR